MNMAKYWITIGAVMAGLGVTMGAMAAHMIDKRFVEQYGGMNKTVAGFEVPASWKYLQDFKTGAEYQMWHALGLIFVGLLASRQPKRSLDLAGWGFLLGILFFSGSLYLLTLTKQTWLGMVAPIGGLLMIFGWFALAWGACPCGKNAADAVHELQVPQPVSHNS